MRCAPFRRNPREGSPLDILKRLDRKVALQISPRGTWEPSQEISFAP